MNRRRFFTGIFMALACSTTKAAQTSVGTSAVKSLWNWGQKKEITLKVGDAHIVKGNTIIHLPKEASDGDYVFLGISNKTLRFPAVVRCDSAAILGDHEDLILDTFCNIRLTYHAPTRNWILA